MLRTTTGPRLCLGLLLLLCAIGFAACGGDDSDDDTTKPSGDRKAFDIQFANIGSTGDSFWSVVRTGAMDAGELFGDNVNYQGTQTIDFVAQAKNIKAAIAKKPDGLIVTDHEPKILNPVIEEAVDAGIPVIMINAGGGNGEAEAAKVGALTFIGENDTDLGRIAGQALKDEGLSNIYCVNQAVGAVNLDSRCAGLKETFAPGTVKVLPVSDSDRTAARNAIQAALQSNSDIDGLMALGQTSAEPAIDALQETGKTGKIKVATADLSPKILSTLEAGDMLFAADQQQYLQGFLAVQYMDLYLRYHLTPPPAVATGPNLVEPDDAAQVTDLSKQGIR